jgi:hypothetical protein
MSIEPSRNRQLFGLEKVGGDTVKLRDKAPLTDRLLKHSFDFTVRDSFAFLTSRKAVDVGQMTKKQFTCLKGTVNPFFVREYELP